MFVNFKYDEFPALILNTSKSMCYKRVYHKLIQYYGVLKYQVQNFMNFRTVLSIARKICRQYNLGYTVAIKQTLTGFTYPWRDHQIGHSFLSIVFPLTL